jgi:hypothetical protein
MRTGFLKQLLWIALCAAVLTAGVRVVIGPVFLSRSAQLTITAKDAGPKWSLDWRNSRGQTINGAWLDLSALSPQPSALSVSLPNYRFAELALRWYDAPGTRLSDPGAVRVRERILGLTFERDIAPAAGLTGTTLEQGEFQSAGAEGGVVWKMPRGWAWGVSWPQAIDVAGVFLLLIALGLGVLAIYRFGGAVRQYDPERLALSAVIAFHAGLALVSPMLFCPDSMDYAVNALRFVEHPSWEPFGPWRLPGYSIFQAPFMMVWKHYASPLGWAQAVLAVLTACLASRIVRVYLSRRWAALALLLVGLDPVLAMWTRHAMPEALCAFMATLIAWGVMQRRLWSFAPWYGAIPAALGLGALAAALCYVRGNYQILAVMAPMAVGAWPLVAGQRLRAGILALVMLAAITGGLAPQVMRNYQKYHRAELVVGSGYTQALSLLAGGAFDYDQSGAFSFEQWRQWRQRDPKAPAPEQVLDVLKSNELAPVPDQPGQLPPWASFDRRAAEVAKESMARHPGRRWTHSGRAMLSLLGLWAPPERSENHYWFAPMRPAGAATTNQPLPPAEYPHLEQRLAQQVFDRTLSDTSGWKRSPGARVFAAVFDGFSGVRPLWAALYLFGVAAALAQRRWSLFILCLIPLAHAAALAVLLVDGIDRYQAPFFPIMTAAACLALARLAGVPGSDEPSASRTQPAP